MPSLKDEKSEFLTFFGVLQSPKWAKNLNFSPTTFVVMVSWVNRWHVKTFAKKMSEKFYFQIFGHFGTIRTVAENGALNQNFGPTTFFVMVSWVNRWHVKTLAKKMSEKFYFLLWAILGTFRAISPKRGPKSKIRYINFWALGRSVFP